MTGRRMLIVTGAFPYGPDYHGIFVKEQISHAAREFESILVVCPMAYFPKTLLRFDRFRRYAGRSQFPRDYEFGNVAVKFPRYLPLPIIGGRLGKVRQNLGFKATLACISESSSTFDIIHAHFVFPGGYVGMKLKHRLGIPLVITAHGGDIYTQPFESDWWHAQTEEILKSADRIITTSTRNRALINEEFGIAEDRIRTIYNGFDPSLFRPVNKDEAMRRLGLPNDRGILLSIGNLVNIKGHKYLLEAVSNLISRGSKIICIIIGRGTLKRDLLRRIHELGIQDEVMIIDGIAHEEVPIWINACDLFILPSLDEGFPTVIPEVLGCGKPVIASKVGGVPEAINDSELGVLAEPMNAADLADKIEAALKKEWNSDLISRIANERYSWDAIGQSLVEVYSDVYRKTCE